MANFIGPSWYQRPEGMRQDISAGGVIVRWLEGHPYIALVREGPFSDYILPKGHVESGESLEDAARREIAEEAGLHEIHLVCELGVQERMNYRRSAWKVIHYFLFVSDDAGFWPEQRSLIEANREKIIRLTASAPSSSARSHHPPV